MIYLFILCSHGSGSTALWKFLQTSPNVSALPVEGQLIETVSKIMRKAPWDDNRTLPWEWIKEEWERVWDLSKPILLEKSPPNLIHAFEIEAHFKNSHFIVMTRDPYAYCEGTKRRGRSGLGYKANASYQEIAEGWIKECKYQIQNVSRLEKVINFTYEELTDNISRISEKILQFLPELETLDIGALFLAHSLHGWMERTITNLNPIQIGRLSAKDLHEINSVLKRNPDVMSYFNYSYLEEAYSPIYRIRLKLTSLYFQYVLRNSQRFKRLIRRLRILISNAQLL